MNTEGMTFILKRAMPKSKSVEGRLESRSIAASQSLFTAGSAACPIRGQAPNRPQDHHGLPFEFPVRTLREAGPPPSSSSTPSPREDPVVSLERAFVAYGERLRSDLQDMKGLCTRLIVQEKQEAAKWYALCAKVIVERDHARQRLTMLAQANANNNGGRNSATRALSSSSSSDTTLNDGSNHRASKRGYDDDDDDDEMNELQDGFPPHSRSKSMDGHRPMKPLRLSPVHSLGAGRMTISSPPSSSATTTPPSSIASDASMITTSSSSAQTMTNPSVSDRPVKRTRSIDRAPAGHPPALVDSTNCLGIVGGGSSRSMPPLQSSTSVRIKQQSRTPSPVTFNSLTTTGGPAAAPAATASNADFSHGVDLMYVRQKGSFVCRACLLEKSKPSSSSSSSSSSTSTEPKVFPSSATWDELRDHCVRLHPEACADVARLHPAEIFELRRRLSV